MRRKWIPVATAAVLLPVLMATNKCKKDDIVTCTYQKIYEKCADQCSPKSVTTCDGDMETCTVTDIECTGSIVVPFPTPLENYFQ